MSEAEAAKVRAMLDTFGLDEQGNPPPLCADLAGWLDTTPRGLKVLKHPWVFGVPYTEMFNANYNYQYEYKREAVAKARADGDAYTYCFLHERPYRLHAFLDVEHTLDAPARAAVLRSIWVDSENIWQNEAIWRTHLLRTDPQAFMEEDEVGDLAAMGEVRGGAVHLTIYRGYQRKVRRLGMSWTTDRSFAERMARMRMLGDAPYLARAEVDRTEVFAFVKSRSEAEIIVPRRKALKSIVVATLDPETDKGDTDAP